MSNVYLEKLRSISGKPLVRELPKLPKLPKGAYDSFGSTATTRIPENGAANDAHTATAGRPLPGMLHIAADPFDPADFGLECITHLHQLGIVATLDGNDIALHGLAEASPAAADEARALLCLHADDLRAALRAQQGARQAIHQAASQDCGDRHE